MTIDPFKNLGVYRDNLEGTIFQEVQKLKLSGKKGHEKFSTKFPPNFFLKLELVKPL